VARDAAHVILSRKRRTTRTAAGSSDRVVKKLLQEKAVEATKQHEENMKYNILEHKRQSQDIRMYHGY
jgi:hypothetical protein